jgi:hypothetical protein
VKTLVAQIRSCPEVILQILLQSGTWYMLSYA